MVLKSQEIHAIFGFLISILCWEIPYSKEIEDVSVTKRDQGNNGWVLQ